MVMRVPPFFEPLVGLYEVTVPTAVKATVEVSKIPF
jgi:hypothetical protein